MRRFPGGGRLCRPRVALCRGERGMPQHLLDGAKIGARLQKVRGEGVADPVGGKMPPDPGPFQRLFENARHASRRERPPPPAPFPRPVSRPVPPRPGTSTGPAAPSPPRGRSAPCAPFPKPGRSPPPAKRLFSEARRVRRRAAPKNREARGSRRHAFLLPPRGGASAGGPSSRPPEEIPAVASTALGL